VCPPWRGRQTPVPAKRLDPARKHPSFCVLQSRQSNSRAAGETLGAGYEGQPWLPESGIAINRQATDVIVRCTSRIMSDTNQSLRATIKPLFSESNRVALDLTDVNYVDSSGVGAIVGLFISAKFANCRLKLICSNESLRHLAKITRFDQKLVNINKRVHDLLLMTGLYMVFDIQSDEASAIQSFGSSSASQV